jgi:hypothetical protein
MPNELGFWTIVIPAASGLAGVLVGGLFTRSNDKRKQKLDFVAQQLRELYSPLLGIRTHIESLSNLRETIAETAETVWGNMLDEARQQSIQELQHLRQQRFPEFRDLITYDNDQFRDTLLPLYREMLKTFREKYWLAQPSTREHYYTLLHFVELWRRHLSGSLPPEVVVALNVREAPLHPFYHNLQEQFDWLQGMLSRAEV